MTAQQRRHVLAIDIGGTHVKLRVSNRPAVHQFDSSPTMTPREMLGQIGKLAKDWTFDRVALGFPGMVVDGRIVSEPVNLGAGWVGFDFAKRIDRPVRIVNDAVMQALGGYEGGRMLFLGFGTALGAVAILDGRIHPMELAHLPFSKRGSIQHYVGGEALERLGPKRWAGNAKTIMRHFSDLLDVHYLVVGGGNACRLGSLPKNARLGDNGLAFIGGFRVWRRSPGIQI
jgi:polyphosphate glucokinase